MLIDQEWKFFFITQPLWATFKLILQFFMLDKLANHFLKVKSNPDILTEENTKFCF